MGWKGLGLGFKGLGSWNLEGFRVLGFRFKVYLKDQLLGF